MLACGKGAGLIMGRLSEYSDSEQAVHRCEKAYGNRLTREQEIYDTLLDRTNEILLQEYNCEPTNSRQIKSLIRTLSEFLSKGEI